jgi:hypothetical protein
MDTKENTDPSLCIMPEWRAKGVVEGFGMKKGKTESEEEK